MKAWLRGLGLEQYAQAFAEHDIGADLLGDLTAEDLKELGVRSLGHRKRLLAAIAALSAPRPAQPSSTPLPTPPMPATERRQVTILFADLCGFTALSQALDPEELQRIVGRYTALVDAIVEGYGGHVDKHIGDAVMALFGAPVAHGDDPIRAARAAIDIHLAVDGLGREFGRDLAAHLGIASGEVVAGGLDRAGQRDYTVLGDSVNIAARLVAAAQPGQTIISDPVYRALSGAAKCEPLGEIRLKGLDKPMRAWRLGELSTDVRSNRGPFVGRVLELDQLKGILAACRTTGSGQVVYLRGDAGIGKTRLVEEVTRLAVQHGIAAHRGLVLDFGVGRGQDPVRALIRSLLGVDAAAGEDMRRGAAAHAVAGGLVPADRAVFLDDLLDLPQTTAMRALYDAMDNNVRNRGKREVAARLVDAVGRRQPILMVVEDLHWADPATLSYLASIATAVRGVPAMLLMTSRLEGDPIGSAWRASIAGTPLTTIDLGPLRMDEALSMASAFIDTTQRVALACIERAAGNPLFLDQLLRNAEEGSDETLPGSIQSLVLARMDRLSPLDKQALQAASVLGQRFDLATLRHLLKNGDYECKLLVDQVLIQPEGEAFLFSHALVQQGVYSSMLKARRRELHREAASWFEGRDRVLWAQHLDRAEDAGASRAYCEAAEALKSGYHFDHALQLVERGLTIATSAVDRHALMCLNGELLYDLGAIPESIEVYRKALDAAPDDVARCRASIGLAEGLRVSEGLTEALALIDSAEKIAAAHDLVYELARIHHLRGNIYFPLGRIEGCAEQHELGLACARRSGLLEAEASALGGLADAAYARGRMRTAFAHFSRCVELSRQHGFGRIEVANRSMVGFSRCYLGEFREALEDGLAAVQSAALVGHQRAEMLGETIAVFASYEMGDFERTAEHLAREMRLIQRLGARRFEAQNLEIEGRVRSAQGRRGDAMEILERARAICREVGLQFSGPKLMGALAVATEDAAERGRFLEEGEELLRLGAVGHNHLWFYRDAMAATLAAGEWQAAMRYADALENYTRAEPLPWSDRVIAETRAQATAALRAAADISAGARL
ncbi:MAG TPA: adenylate/guanylate cyclase domain-containing protein [Stellaceae bacterium]|nr:adenylate/guanylate cyclase domain-containing protein [Stellaceae bacterium]